MDHRARNASSGLGRLVDRFEQSGSRPTTRDAEPDLRIERPLPASLLSSQTRLLSDAVFDAAGQETLIADLRYFLGDDGFYWLAATALYPELRSDITIFLGLSLTERAEPNGRALFNEDRFLRIESLPWSRTGRFPDWIGWLLFKSMSTKEQRQAQDVIARLLAEARRAGGELLMLGRLTLGLTSVRASRDPPGLPCPFGDRSLRVPQSRATPLLWNFSLREDGRTYYLLSLAERCMRSLNCTSLPLGGTRTSSPLGTGLDLSPSLARPETMGAGQRHKLVDEQSRSYVSVRPPCRRTRGASLQYAGDKPSHHDQNSVQFEPCGIRSSRRSPCSSYCPRSC